MKILFTKSTKPLSVWIRGITKEPVSHVALQFGRIVIHSNLLGLHLEWAENFHNECSVIYQLEKDTTSEDNQRLDKLLQAHEFAFYDFGALFFVGFCLLLKAWAKIPLPKQNLWRCSGMFDCTEWATEYEYGQADAMITPYGLYQKLLISGKYTETKTI